MRLGWPAGEGEALTEQRPALPVEVMLVSQPLSQPQLTADAMTELLETRRITQPSPVHIVNSEACELNKCYFKPLEFGNYL